VHGKAALTPFFNLISRKSSLTAESLESYRDLIETATADLEAHLENIDEKLRIIFEQTVTESDSDAAERRLIKEEQLSTRKCLQICAQLSDHINQIQLTPKRNASSPGITVPDSFPERVTNVGLQECKNSLIHTAAKLERYMKDLMDRLVTKSKTALASEEDVTDLARLRDEWEAARQCIDICSQADYHLKENISTIDNYATGDAVQFMVSTDGKTIHGKNRGLGWRTRQVGGHLSDVSVQKLSQDMTSISVRDTGNEGQSLRGDTTSVPSDGVENRPISDFRGRYGRGFKLKSKSVPDVTTSSTRSAESGQTRAPQC
jgi:Fungal N-terminal domain of STAND proteins